MVVDSYISFPGILNLRVWADSLWIESQRNTTNINDTNCNSPLSHVNVVATYTQQSNTFFSPDPPVKPTITGISANQTVTEGERVTFTCEATGNPLPQIKWKIFLESGHDNDPQLERPSPRSIRISSVTPRDAGRYICIAENDSGNDTEAVYLIVLGEYLAKFIKFHQVWKSDLMQHCNLIFAVI